MVETGLPISKVAVDGTVVLAAETVLQRWLGKGSVNSRRELPYPWTHRVAKGSHLNITTVDRIQLSFGDLLHWLWKWALLGFVVVEYSEFWGIYTSPSPSNGHWDGPFRDLLLLSLAPLSLFFCSVLSLELELLITSKCLLGNLSLSSTLPPTYLNFTLC